MIGPAGFMRAPNTHEGRPPERGPIQPWETIRLTQVWVNKQSGSHVTIEAEPHSIRGEVVFKNMKSRRKGGMLASGFLKRYEPACWGVMESGPSA